MINNEKKRKSEKIWSIVSIALCAAMVLTALITLHVDGKFSSGGEEASRVENASFDETKVSSTDVELLSDYSEITTTEDDPEKPLKAESLPGVETPIYDIEADCFIFD